MLQIRYFRINNDQTLLQIFLQHFCKGLMVVYAISGLSASLVSSVEIWVNGWKFLSVVANPAHAKCSFVFPSFIDLLSFLLSFLPPFCSFYTPTTVQHFSSISVQVQNNLWKRIFPLEEKIYPLYILQREYIISN